MTAAIDLATLEHAAAAGEWYVTHLAEVEREIHAVARPVRELSGVVYEIALHRARRRRLQSLTAAQAVRLALRREQDNYLVFRPRGEARPLVVGGIELDEVMAAADSPLETMLVLEAERAREDDDCDHDDRLSYMAKRAAAGWQPIELPRTTRESDARMARRFRVRARDLRAAGQGDLWLGMGEAA